MSSTVLRLVRPPRSASASSRAAGSCGTSRVGTTGKNCCARSPTDTLAAWSTARSAPCSRCPLCHERGRAVLLEAQLERDEELLVVTELEGCRHADGFGDPVLLTFEEEWRLIEAALDARAADLTPRR